MGEFALQQLRGAVETAGPGAPSAVLAGGTRLDQELQADRVAELSTGLLAPAARLQHTGTLPAVIEDMAVRALNRHMTAGRPLEERHRMPWEAGRGVDLSRVRVHADAASGRAVAAVGARAATVGQHIFGGPETFNSGPEGRRILAHEVAHTVQQAGRAPALQCDAVDNVRKKLSYGVLDWAVTDNDAKEALAALAALPDAELAKELPRLEQKYVDRLIDNLPDPAKTGPAYRKVMTALGAARTAPEAGEDLSYGLFDWAVTDTDVTNVFTSMVALPAPEQVKFLLALDASGKLARLINNSTASHQGRYIRPWITALHPGRLTPDEEKILRVIVTESDDGALPTLLLAASTRFGIPVGRETAPDHTPADWTVAKLRTTYLALDSLPESHVAGNVMLNRLGAFSEGRDAKGDITEGEYYGDPSYHPDPRELDINVAATGDISSTVLHETGHAVDRQMGWTTGDEPAKSSRGGWVQYENNTGICATDMVSDSQAGILALAEPQREDVQAQMRTAMRAHSTANMARRIRALPWFAALPPARSAAVLADPALHAVTMGVADPWKKADGGTRLGAADAHVYEESYPSNWNRYEYQARTRILTNYQFRDPGEWFSEVYAAYFGGPATRKRLHTKDPDTEAYFTSAVAPLARSRNLP